MKFRPQIKQMLVAPSQEKKYNRSPHIIPVDTDANRAEFKSVPGVTKFL